MLVSNPVECPIGTYVNAANDACLDCPANTYQDQPNQLTCKDCPSGTETADVGSDSVDDCQGRCQEINQLHNGYRCLAGIT